MNRRHADAEQAAAAEELAPLTPRQREVLVMICKGCSQEEASALLRVSVKVISYHVSEIKAKLEMSTIEAAVLATRAKWV